MVTGKSMPHKCILTNDLMVLPLLDMIMRWQGQPLVDFTPENQLFITLLRGFRKGYPCPSRRTGTRRQGVSKMLSVTKIAPVRYADHKPGVFSLDFKSQEDRMTAYLTKNVREPQLFIQGKDSHGDLAKKLHVDRDTGKSIRHGTRYGRGPASLPEGVTDEGISTTVEGAREPY